MVPRSGTRPTAPIRCATRVCELSDASDSASPDLRFRVKAIVRRTTPCTLNQVVSRGVACRCGRRWGAGFGDFDSFVVVHGADNVGGEDHCGVCALAVGDAAEPGWGEGDFESLALVVGCPAEVVE